MMVFLSQEHALKWLVDMDHYYMHMGYPKGTAYRMMGLPAPDELNVEPELPALEWSPNEGRKKDCYFNGGRVSRCHL